MAEEEDKLLGGDGKTQKFNWKLPLAMIFILSAVLSWIAMAFLLQAVQTGESGFNKPYFMVYVIHSTYTIFLPICLIWYVILLLSESLPEQLKSSNLKAYVKRKFFVAMGINALMVICAYTWYLSLPQTSVAANTGIYNSACVFVFFLSCIFLKEKVTIWKVLSVTICMVGVTIMAVFQDGGNDTTSGTTLGFFYVIISTIFYAMYEVFYKKFGSPDVSPENLNDPVESTGTRAFGTLLYLGFTGLSTITMYWPGLFILSVTGIERFQLPSHSVWMVIFFNAFLDCVFNCLILLTIMMTSPLFASIGALLTIPVSIIAGWIFKHTLPGGMCFLGASCIVLGFLGLNIAEHLEAKKEKMEHSKIATTESISEIEKS